MQSLNFEEREIFHQVMAEVWPLLTDRQAECLRLQVDGKTQAEVGVILGIPQQTVSFHVRAARRKVAEVASGYV